LLAENPGELLPTIRSRSVNFALSAVSAEEIEAVLAEGRQIGIRERERWSHVLSGGGIGRALSFDLKTYTAARSQALVLLNSALRANEHTELFKMTESFRPGAEGREKMDSLLSTLYSLLEDLMFLESNAPQLVRNTDILGELKKLAESADFAWITRASQGLGEVERGMRRNLFAIPVVGCVATALELPT